MKTQLSVRVRREGLVSAMFGRFYLTLFAIIIAILGKTSVIVSIDGEKHKLKRQSEPHLIDIEPGIHTIEFIDPQRACKGIERVVTNLMISIFGLFIGLSGSDDGSVIGGMIVGDILGSTVDTFFEGEDGTLKINIKEGDVIRVRCKAKLSGSVVVDRDR
ncbi:MAG: hypothetical protein NC122_09680 [Faecalibacterium sp.]|nr:hypothetical protein [Ruminococcus sp.]MCM1392912.1 hypothetical protein [Ruminococcus sp.]MCM1486460.1 hypothetical protein [Faecalibacterium sp.]